MLTTEKTFLFSKMSGDIAKSIIDRVRGRELKPKAEAIEFKANNKRFEIKITEI